MLLKQLQANTPNGLPFQKKEDILSSNLGRVHTSRVESKRMDAQPQNERDAAGGTPVEVFISYAPEDEALLRQLETHLSKLKRQGVISTWYDRQIVAGMDWAHAIDTHLEEARVILLLISADFLGSEYCYSREMRYALERHEAGCDSTQFLSSRLTHNLSSDWLLPPLCDNRAI